MLSFFVYLLQCSDGSFYAGHTDDLERRLAQHECGAFPSCYTFDRRPVRLMWSQEFPTRLEALAKERQLKGWSRAKKEALALGNWDRIHGLASRRRGRPSTSGSA